MCMVVNVTMKAVKSASLGAQARCSKAKLPQAVPGATSLLRHVPFGLRVKAPWHRSARPSLSFIFVPSVS